MGLPFTQLSPSTMYTNFMSLKQELGVLKDTEIDMLHIDIMGEHYVSNFTLGPDMTYTVQGYSTFPLDFYLITEDDGGSLEHIAKHICSTFTFHPEAFGHPICIMDTIPPKDCEMGIATELEISLEGVNHLLTIVNLGYVTTVSLDFSMQKLLDFLLNITKEFVDWRRIKRYNFTIDVDGNENGENISLMITPAADIFESGTSYIIRKQFPRKSAF